MITATLYNDSDKERVSQTAGVIKYTVELYFEKCRRIWQILGTKCHNISACTAFILSFLFYLIEVWL